MRYVWAILLLLLSLSVPIFGLISDYRTIILVFIISIILFRSFYQIRLDTLQVFSILLSTIGFIWLGLQIRILSGDYAYLFNMGILILGLFFNQGRIQKHQDDSQMIVLNEDLPPSIAVTSIALGPLKGMVSAGLMWRAIDKEDKKEYMESYQLS